MPDPLILYAAVRLALPLEPSMNTYTSQLRSVSPVTVTVVTLVSVVSRYPVIMRRFPGWSAAGRRQVLLDVQVTVAPDAAPLSSTSASGLDRVAPVALFQFGFATTPA